MTYFKLFFSWNTWRYGFSLTNTLKIGLSSVAVLWLIVEVLNFFVPATNLDLKCYWRYFVALAVVWTLWETRPRLRHRYRIRNSDVRVEVIIGDLFRFSKGAFVIPTNTTFDTDINKPVAGRPLISPRSVQGQFTSKFYPNALAQLDHDLSSKLQQVPHQSLTTAQKSTGKTDAFPVGTVAMLHRADRNAYFLAMSAFNSTGNVQSSVEDVRFSLAQLWDYVGHSGDYEESILIPLLGTGFSRITATREALAQEILLSFLAATRNRKFCDSLIICIHPSDYRKHSLDIPLLKDFFRLHCELSPGPSSSSNPIGTPT